jgi:aryl-alcohol dehydrogenase-like predicted oxidoreductase
MLRGARRGWGANSAVMEVSPMEYRYLGRSGLRVSELCLRTMSFGREASEEDSLRMADIFFDAGGTFVDTANGYGGGTGEEIVGRWLATKPRDQVAIATKVFFPMGEGRTTTGSSAPTS